MTVEKPKPQSLLRPITTRANSLMNQSEFLAITCKLLNLTQSLSVAIVITELLLQHKFNSASVLHILIEHANEVIKLTAR